MDAERFDTVTKALAGGASRRRVLAGVGGGLLGLALAGRGRRAAAQALPPLPLGLAYPPEAASGLGAAAALGSTSCPAGYVLCVSGAGQYCCTSCCPTIGGSYCCGA
jgi:hypothetical protein